MAGAAQVRHVSIVECLASDLNNYVQFVNLRAKNEIEFRGNVQKICFPLGLQSLPWRLVALTFLMPMLLLACWRAGRQNSIIVCYDRDLMVLTLVMCLAKVFGVPVVHELTEYPSEVFPKNWYGKVSLFIFERILLNKLSGVSVISRSLYQYVAVRVKRIEIFIMPAIVDSRRFELMDSASRQSEGNSFRFTYCGSLSEEKDGVLSMIRAFSAVSVPAGLALELHLYGYGSDLQGAQVQHEIDAHSLNSRVFVHGVVDHSKIPDLMQSSGALLLCRPVSKQASGGFPTKLVEYLASGVPVITTITSDIARYLVDGVDAFLCPPNDPDQISRRMSAVISDLDEAMLIGIRGQDVCRKYFDVGSNTEELFLWLQNISRANVQ
jgi:glycosyltransferase involved in cell wall biosynthesis